MPGRRLVYSVGILWLAATHPVMAAILVSSRFSSSPTGRRYGMAAPISWS